MTSDKFYSAILKSKKFFGYLVLILVLAGLIVLLRSEILAGWEEQVVQSLIGGTIAAIFLSVLIHLGIVLDTDDIHEETRKSISGEIAGRSKDIVKQVSEKFEARYKWGLHTVVDQITEGEELLDVENSKVKWLNTKFQDAPLQIKVIRDAVRRGCNVKLLLMHPDSDIAAYRGAYTVDNFKDDTIIKEQTRDYRDSARTSAREILRLYKELAANDELVHSGDPDASENGITPGFQLRFYKDSPAIPMLLWKGEFLKRGFTGFYLNSYSRLMPYLGWHGEGTEMLDHLFDYFDRKWYFARDWDASNLDPTDLEPTTPASSEEMMS